MISITSAAGPGKSLQVIEHRCAKLLKLAKASSISDSTPAARNTVRSDAAATGIQQQR